MKVGLLICDAVPEKYQSEFRDYPEMFSDLFPNYEMVGYKVREGKFPKNITDHEVYMATGSVHSVYEDLDWIQKTKAFIRKIKETNRYFIGFCFGHQLLAEAMGGKVEKAAIGWCVGTHQLEIIQKTAWMEPLKTKANFLFMCQDQVIKLPPNAERLASSPDCPNAMIQIGDKMLSIQGHPEFPKAYDQILMETRRDKIGPAKVEAGIASLKQDLDIELFRSWVDNFIQLEEG